ncbi:hypothetical protein ATDW_36810 (plasmid) [Asticcacaulis sp. DW145]|uniref:DNA sulfur modification protein DndB n=1 Tax=Asticcacaulis sp. DW145 TaxID=3095608 RepID=UPI003088D6A0|nr:hypothetical protein ATDW_36810 [Asticcacaulis sp. DW145]
MALSLRKSSALNLELEGSTGSFRVGSIADTNNTLEVKYFLTDLSLDYESGASAQVLSHLAPVRELFETEKLEFDEIMQRDIDDARVSAELVPYLLDKNSRDMVKLFPPIVVVILPTVPNANRPADKYPPVVTEVGTSADGQEERRTRSGVVGQEVFEFSQPILDGEVVKHDLNRLKLNTERTRLVIVDGQHRAMALLALYRNLQDKWTDERRAPYKDFYEEWTPNYIRQFQLSHISLPVMFCTFPELDEHYKGDFDLKKAARSIFLTLNKTARKVSESRNRLLDDNDLIALFLRKTLSAIKNRDALSQNSIRIFNVELDQSGDRIKIESAIAVTGVNHIYYIIEHLLLNKPDDVSGISARAGKYYKRTDLEAFGASRRLDARNILGAALADTTYRDIFSRNAGDKLAEQYDTNYGTYLLDFYVRFAPIEAHCRASLSLEENLKSQENRKLRPILFEGQGMSRVFNDHRDNLREKLKSKEFGSEATKIEEIIKNLDITAGQIKNAIDRFKGQRAANFVDSISDKNKLKDGPDVHPKIVGFISDLYDNVFSSVAFQTAAVATFFGEVERAQAEAKKVGAAAIDVSAEFDAYLTSLHALFVPRSVSQFRSLVEVFVGKVEGEITEWKLVRTPHTFREVVYPGEMQPDQWPKYRYMMLELWRPQNEHLQAVVTASRDICRAQVFKSLVGRRKDEFTRNEVKREEDLTPAERATFVTQAYEAVRTLLNNLGWKTAEIPSKKTFEGLSTEPAEIGPAAVAEEDEVWESAEDAVDEGVSSAE